MSVDRSNVPAWKRAGIIHKAMAKSPTKGLGPSGAKVKKPVIGTNNENRVPKREKVPKAKRAPPPESDQLAYLRQFVEDKDAWKFSKQKQNWLIRNAFNIEESYGAALEVYISNIQGASRGRLIDNANDIVKRWNEAMSEPEPILNETGSEAKATDDEVKPSDRKVLTFQKEMKKAPKTNSHHYTKPPEYVARRAQAILETLTDSSPELLFLD